MTFFLEQEFSSNICYHCVHPNVHMYVYAFMPAHAEIIIIIIMSICVLAHLLYAPLVATPRSCAAAHMSPGCI